VYHGYLHGWIIRIEQSVRRANRDSAPTPFGQPSSIPVSAINQPQKKFIGRLTIEDADAIRREAPSIVSVSPSIARLTKSRYATSKVTPQF
jgi:hypothetical protein